MQPIKTIDFAAALQSLYAGSGTPGVYALRCPLTERVRYVGSSSFIERRLVAHHSTGATSGNRDAWTAWRNELKDRGLRMGLDVLAIAEDPRQRRQAEHDWFHRFVRVGESDLNSHRKIFGAKSELVAQIEYLQQANLRLQKENERLRAALQFC